MKYVKLFSALAVIMAIVMCSTTGVFAQANVSADVNADSVDVSVDLMAIFN
jgi:hypothetical protein